MKTVLQAYADTRAELEAEGYRFYGDVVIAPGEEVVMNCHREGCDCFCISVNRDFDPSQTVRLCKKVRV